MALPVGGAGGDPGRMTRGTDPSPPRSAAALLALCLPPGRIGEAILGDLHEDYLTLIQRRAEGDEKARQSGPVGGRTGALLRAGLWYWCQVPLLGGPFLLRRILHRRLYRGLPGRAGVREPGGGWLTGLSRELRFGFRTLLRDKGFTAVAVLTLGIGIGATTSIFSVINAVLLRPLPYPESDRLVVLRDVKAPQYLSGIQVAPGHFVEWQARATSFNQMGAFVSRTYTLTGRGNPVRISAASVSGGTFTLLGVTPVLGRDLRSGEDQPGQDAVVITSHRFWQQDLGGDPGILGQSLSLDGRPYTIVGVLPSGVDFPEPGVDLWTPMALTSEQRQAHGNHHLWVVARLSPGVPMGQAQTEMNGIARQLEAEYPDFNAGWGVRVDGLLESRVGGRKTVLWTLLGAVALVLLIACANVANMLLVRAAGRHREMAVRAAMGAAHWRLLRQAFTESALLGVGGGLLGVLLAEGGVVILPKLVSNWPRIDEMSLDGPTLIVTVLSVLLAMLFFGTAPAAQALKSDPTVWLKETGRGSSSGPDRQRLRRILVVTEVALALVLLTGAGLLIRSLRNLQQVDPGFSPENALVAHIELPEASYSAGPQTAAFFNRLTDEVSRLPGVEAAGVAFTLPFIRDQHLGFAIDGRPPARPGEMPTTLYYAVSPGYFEAIGVQLVRGRLFTEGDSGEAPGAVIINQTMARRHFPGEDPIGKRIHLTNGPVDFREIVGIVADVRQNGLDDEAREQVYEPFSQQTYQDLDMWLVVRSEGDPLSLSTSVRRKAQELESTLPLADLQLLDGMVARWVRDRQGPAELLTFFAGVALLLATLGIYGVMSYSVAQRTREVGIRMALGARGPDLMELVFREGLILTLSGLAIGMVLSLSMTGLMERMLYGITATDPATLAMASMVLGSVALVAMFIPVHRATRVDPNVALRSE
jgi:putative ABC transport system permease protein